jgi:hypothetical protein
VGLEVLSTFLKELRPQSLNLRTRERLHVVLLAENDTRHGVDGLRRQLEHLLRRIGTILPLTLRIILSNTPPRLVIQGLDCRIVIVSLVMGCFQATGTPMAKILRLHLSAQCAFREITILHNFAIEKVEKNISLQRSRDLKTLFQNCFKMVSKWFKKNSQLSVESELNHKQIRKMYMRQSFLHQALKFLDYF